MIKQNWNINEDEKNRILNLHESATKRLYLSEQENEEVIDDSYYQIVNTPLYFKINEGYLYCSVWDDRKNKEATPWTYIGGDLYNFKVNYKSGELISDKGWGLNFKITDEYWNEIGATSLSSQGIRPMQYNNVEYKLIAMSPPFSDKRLPHALDKTKVGVPTVYTAKIVAMDITLLEGRYEESEDDTISPVMYVKKGNKGILIQLFPGVSAKYFSNKPTPETPEDIPTDIPFELNIESPFRFNETNLTDEAKQEFKDFIKSIKTNYSDATGDVEVISSASIDEDPEGKLKTGQKRKDYNMDLSKKRAETIASLLKNSLPGIKLNFIPKGIGETDQFAKGKKWPDVTDENQTAPNRRLIIKLPQITKKGS
jgi:outer membrane protein OmpA-like peptidoglycan-associated protein